MSAPPSGYCRVVTALCRAEGWPAPVAEYRFCSPRRWRFDVAWPAHWLAVEVQGGIFVGGRHTRGAALAREYAKLNAAAVGGWVVLLVRPTEVTDGTLSRLLAAYFERLWPSRFAQPLSPAMDVPAADHFVLGKSAAARPL